MNQELYISYCKKETKFTSKMMKKQAEINYKMRAILINWMVDMSSTLFKISDEERRDVLFLAVMILDRYSDKEVIRRADYQLIGAICMKIAFKYEGKMLFSCEQIMHYCCVDKDKMKATKDWIIKTEWHILKTLDYHISFINSYMILITLFECDGSSSIIRKMAGKLLESLIDKQQILFHKPSIVAASVLYITNVHYNKEDWSTKLRKMTKYKLLHFETCKDRIQGLVDFEQMTHEEE